MGRQKSIKATIEQQKQEMKALDKRQKQYINKEEFMLFMRDESMQQEKQKLLKEFSTFSKKAETLRKELERKDEKMKFLLDAQSQNCEFLNSIAAKIGATQPGQLQIASPFDQFDLEGLSKALLRLTKKTEEQCEEPGEYKAYMRGERSKTKVNIKRGDTPAFGSSGELREGQLILEQVLESSGSYEEEEEQNSKNDKNEDHQPHQVEVKVKLKSEEQKESYSRSQDDKVNDDGGDDSGDDDEKKVDCVSNHDIDIDHANDDIGDAESQDQ